MNKKIPMRKCVGCGEMKEKKDLIRILHTAEGEFLLDRTGRKNGRGAYLCPNSACLKMAAKNHGLERSFQGPVPKFILETLTKEMEEA